MTGDDRAKNWKETYGIDFVAALNENGISDRRYITNAFLSTQIAEHMKCPFTFNVIFLASTYACNFVEDLVKNPNGLILYSSGGGA